MDLSASARSPRARLTPERRGLAERYVPLARKLARPMKAAWPHLADDLDSASQLALVEAAEAFDPGRSVLFSTYARQRIRYAMLDVLRASYPESARPDPILAASFRSSTARDGRPAPVFGGDMPPVGHDLEVVDEVERWLHRLPRRHAETCRHIYLHGRSLAETARVLGYSTMNIHRLHKKSLEMLGAGRTDPRRAAS